MTIPNVLTFTRNYSYWISTLSSILLCYTVRHSLYSGRPLQWQRIVTIGYLLWLVLHSPTPEDVIVTVNLCNCPECPLWGSFSSSLGVRSYIHCIPVNLPPDHLVIMTVFGFPKQMDLYIPQNRHFRQSPKMTYYPVCIAYLYQAEVFTLPLRRPPFSLLLASIDHSYLAVGISRRRRIRRGREAQGIDWILKRSHLGMQKSRYIFLDF